MRRIIFILFSSLLALMSLNAQYAEDVLRFSQIGLNVGARTLGIGNAGVGYATDYSALFWNPANLALARDYEFSFGLSNSQFKNKVLYSGTNTLSDISATGINNAGIVYPMPVEQGSLTFAFGYGSITNFSSSASFSGFNTNNSLIESLAPWTWLAGMSSSDLNNYLDNNIPYQLYLANIDSTGKFLKPVVIDNVQQEVQITEGGGINTWAFGCAVDVAKNFSFGVTLNLMTGSYSYERQFIEQDSKNYYNRPAPNDFDMFSYISSIKGELTGYNFLLGITYRKQGSYRIGFTLKTPINYDISEEFSDEGQSWFDDGSTYKYSLPGATRYTIRTPIVFSSGVAVQALDWLLLAADAEYTDWTQMEFTNNNPDLKSENRLIKSIFRPTTNLRGGGEITFWDLGLKIRGGAIYNPSPYKNDRTENDQLYLTSGVSFTIDNDLVVNAGIAYGVWKSLRNNYYYKVGTDSFISSTKETISTATVNITFSYLF